MTKPFWYAAKSEESQAIRQRANACKSPSGRAAVEPIDCSARSALQVITRRKGALGAGEWTSSTCLVPRSWTCCNQRVFVQVRCALHHLPLFAPILRPHSENGWTRPLRTKVSAV